MLRFEVGGNLKYFFPKQSSVFHLQVVLWAHLYFSSFFVSACNGHAVTHSSCYYNFFFSSFLVILKKNLCCLFLDLNFFCSVCFDVLISMIFIVDFGLPSCWYKNKPGY